MLFKKIALVTIATSSIFVIFSVVIVFSCNFPLFDSLIVGFALMFSSTVIGLKLIPTTELHHRHTGELMISVLLFQDILAILLILFITGGGSTEPFFILVPFLIFKGIALILFSILFVKYCILRLFRKFDVIQEYIFKAE